MNKYAFVTILLICFFTNGYAQKTLSDYSHIIIPEQFDFLSEKDKYQINSLTKFLFNKYGFHAFIENEVPDNLVTCDGLKANVIKSAGIIYTKLQIIISDCHGKEIYRSAEGKSKIKEYNRVFNDALRKAFAGIIGLDVQQKEISYNTTIVSSETKNEVVANQEVKEVNTIENSNQVVDKKTNAKSKIPTRQYSAYQLGDDLFLLRKTEQGYKLYQDVTFNPYASDINNGLRILGEILVSNNKVFYLGQKEKLVDAHFDEYLNLIIDKLSGKLIYKFID